jgi:hypothetical protein
VAGYGNIEKRENEKEKEKKNFLLRSSSLCRPQAKRFF